MNEDYHGWLNRQRYIEARKEEQQMKDVADFMRHLIADHVAEQGQGTFPVSADIGGMQYAALVVYLMKLKSFTEEEAERIVRDMLRRDFLWIGATKQS